MSQLTRVKWWICFAFYAIRSSRRRLFFIFSFLIDPGADTQPEAEQIQWEKTQKDHYHRRQRLLLHHELYPRNLTVS